MYHSSITSKICFGLFLALGILLCVVALVAKFIVFGKIVDDHIAKMVMLKNGSTAYDRWAVLPIPITYKIYFFNVSNPDDILRGGKPMVQEIGPYIYRVHRSKFNISKEEDSLLYNEHLLFEFDENASYPLTDSDALHIVNLPLVAMIDITEREVRPMVPFLDTVIPLVFNNPKDIFLSTTPKDFLFDGVFMRCDTNDVFLKLACNMIEKLAPRTISREQDGRLKFSLLTYKNDTDEGVFAVNSGEINAKSLGQLSSWNGFSSTNIWQANSSCNVVYGSDSRIYAPFETPESTINIFSVDICRTVAMEYLEPVKFAGIDGLRYISKRSAFASPKRVPENQCYCLKRTYGIVDENQCLLDGAMELSTCHGAPIVYTLPHFYLTDERYQNGVEGLKPEAEKHQNFVDLQPNTGIPLKGYKRAQFNIFLREVENVGVTKGLNTTLMPMFWFDEGAELTDEFIDLLHTEYIDNVHLLNIIGWASLGCGVSICLMTIILYICCRKSAGKSKKVSS